MRGWSATTATTASLPTSWWAWTSRKGASSRCGSAPATSGRTAIRSPARTSATTGRTSPPTSPWPRSARPGRISSMASHRASSCSTSTPCAIRGRGRIRSSRRRWPARGPSRCTRPPTISRRSTPATPVKTSWRSRPGKKAGATGPVCTPAASGPTRTPTPISPAFSPGSIPRRLPPSATCSSETPISTGWTRTAGNCPTSIG